jgi:SAM-dependent methyltransferase
MVGMHEDPPLHDLSPTTRFSDRAADYVRFRPDYPAAAIDAILNGVGDPAALIAADVGAGTGISARLLAERGTRVIAIEPNREMLGAAAPHEHIAWVVATAEATALAAGSVGLVLSAQAFHWFRQPDALSEFHRVLAPSGRLVLMWNSRDRTDPLTREYIEAIHAVQGEHPAERRPFDPAVVSARGEFGEAWLKTFPYRQSLDREGLAGRAWSASYVPREGPRAEQLVQNLDALHQKYRDERGMIALRYRTEVWIAERR